MFDKIRIRSKWTTAKKMVQSRRWQKLLKEEKEHRLKYKFDITTTKSFSRYLDEDIKLSWRKIELRDIDYKLESRGLIYILTGINLERLLRPFNGQW